MLEIVCATLFIGVVNNVLKFIMCCCTWIEIYNISIDRYNHVVTNIF